MASIRPGQDPADDAKWHKFLDLVQEEFPELGKGGAVALMRASLHHYLAPTRPQPPYESWQLSNANAEIRRLKQRLEGLRANLAHAEAAADQEHETRAGTVTYREDAEAARVQLLFDGKPAADVRDELKGRGFRWSPKAGAWQRHLNANGRHAARAVLEAIT